LTCCLLVSVFESDCGCFLKCFSFGNAYIKIIFFIFLKLFLISAYQNDLKKQKKNINLNQKKNKKNLNFFKNIFEMQKQTDSDSQPQDY